MRNRIGGFVFGLDKGDMRAACFDDKLLLEDAVGAFERLFPGSAGNSSAPYLRKMPMLDVDNVQAALPKAWDQRRGSAHKSPFFRALGSLLGAFPGDDPAKVPEIDVSEILAAMAHG